MRYFFLTLITILTLMVVSLPMQAKEITLQTIEPQVKKYVINHYKNLYDSKIEVTCGRISGVPFDVPDGNLQVKLHGSVRDNFVERTIVRVSVYVDGKFQKSFGVPVTLAMYEDVWVATQPIQRDDSLSLHNVKITRRDITKIALTAAKSSNDLSNTRVLKTFKTGDILDHRFIEKNPIVLRNSLVEIIFKSSTVAITIPGEAMESGRMGDLIRVKSKEFNKQYVGQVVADGTVLVSI